MDHTLYVKPDDTTRIPKQKQAESGSNVGLSDVKSNTLSINPTLLNMLVTESFSVKVLFDIINLH